MEVSPHMNGCISQRWKHLLIWTDMFSSHRCYLAQMKLLTGMEVSPFQRYHLAQKYARVNPTESHKMLSSKPSDLQINSTSVTLVYHLHLASNFLCKYWHHLSWLNDRSPSHGSVIPCGQKHFTDTEVFLFQRHYYSTKHT
jgi:hypothetical protein